MLEDIRRKLAEEGIILNTDLELSEYFGDDFRNIITFCKEKSISIVMGEKEVEFLNTIGPRADVRYGNKSGKKVKSLDDIILVHKTTGIPQDDRINPLMAELTETQTITATVDGRKVSKEVEMPRGHNSIHFCMNAEVKDHHGSSWDHCDVIVMQPLTEKLYEDVVCLNPADTFFGKKIDLEGALIVCSNKEKYEEALRTNPKSTIIYCPVMKPGFGDKLSRAMGYHCFYEFSGGTTDYSKKSAEDMYEEELQEKYPKLVKSVGLPDDYLIHVGLKINGMGSTHIEEQRLIMEEASKEDTFEEVIGYMRKSMPNFRISPPYAKAIYAGQDTFSWEETLGKNYRRTGRILDQLGKMYTFDAEEVFAIITEGVEVTEANKMGLIRLKEMVIYATEKHNKYIAAEYASRATVKIESGHSVEPNEIMENIYEDNPTEYDGYIKEIVMCEEIAQDKEMLTRRTERDVEYSIPPQYYDYSKYLEAGRELKEINFDDEERETIDFFFANKDKIELTVSKPKNEPWVTEFFEQKSKISNDEERRVFFTSYFAREGIILSDEELENLVYVDSCIEDNNPKDANLYYQGTELLLIQNKRQRYHAEQSNKENTTSPAQEESSIETNIAR